MKYVFGTRKQEEEKKEVFISDLDDLADELGIYAENSGNLPCYASRICDVGEEPEGVNILELLYFLFEGDADVMLVFSVTSNETRYSDWIEAASMVFGANVTITNRKRSGREYEVALITLPTVNSLV